MIDDTATHAHDRLVMSERVAGAVHHIALGGGGVPLPGLVRLRKQHRLTQAYMAAQLRISQPTYRRLELGMGASPVRRVMKVAAFFNVSVSELMGYTPAA